MNKTAFEEALLQFFIKQKEVDFKVSTNLGDTRTYKASYFFRSLQEMPKREVLALKAAKGRVLDIGAGVGSHALALQEKKVSVSALENSAVYCDIMKQRGVKNVIQANFWKYVPDEPFDTLLLLMNGLGMAERISLLPEFLSRLNQLLKKGGNAFVDSGDISYLFDSQEELEEYQEEVDYYGEITFTVSYNSRVDNPFPWMFVDYETLKMYAEWAGFSATIEKESLDNNYLARLTKL